MTTGRIPWLIVAALALLLVLSTCSARGAMAERDAQLDSARTQTLALRADSMGWSVRLEGATADLNARLHLVADSNDVLEVATAALAREVDLLGGQVRSLAEMYLGAVGQIEAAGVVHARDPESLPDSVTAEVDDGLLAARLYYRPPNVLGADPYRVSIELVSAVTETPDGRALFTARAADPRVTVRLGDVYWSPPPPVNYCGLGTRVKWGLGGSVAGFTLQQLVGAFKGGSR